MLKYLIFKLLKYFLLLFNFIVKKSKNKTFKH